MSRAKRCWWLCSMAAATCLACLLPAQGGVILINTRGNSLNVWDAADPPQLRGPGMASPEDVAVGILLADNGYSIRMLPDFALNGYGDPSTGDPIDPAIFMPRPGVPEDEPFKIDLFIVPGTGASSEAPPVLKQPADASLPGEPPWYGVPAMIGEHVVLKSMINRPGSVFMYTGTSGTGDVNARTTQYMKIVNPDHPITKGIPTDAEGRVKIWRDPYPNEEAHVPPGGRNNYNPLWCYATVANAAPGTQVLGVIADQPEKSVFAVIEKGTALAPGAWFDTVAPARMVHFFVNGGGSGDARRNFLALNEMGRTLFLRAAQWAMGEDVPPYEGEEDFGIIDITPAGAQALNLSWEGSASRTYAIQASLDALTWSNAVKDIAGMDGTITRVLDVAASPKSLFLRVSAQ